MQICSGTHHFRKRKSKGKWAGVAVLLLFSCSVMSDSVLPHRQQPTRLPRPWDSPGKNSGVCCHFLLQCMKVKSESEVTQSCPTLSNPRDYSPPGSSIHGIFQAGVLEWHECNCATVWAFFGIGMKTDLFQSCGHWCVFQICCHIEYSTSTASSFRIWNTQLEFFHFH